MSALEPALDDLEKQIEAALRVLTDGVKKMKQARTAAQLGQLRDLRRSLAEAASLASSAAEGVAQVRSGWTFDERSHFESGAYAQELLALAKAEGLQAFDSDERILCYPVIVKVSPTDASVQLDRKRVTRVRPSVLVRKLKVLQRRPPGFKAEQFLESLSAAYDYVVAQGQSRLGAVVKLTEIYRVLTLKPGAKAEYSEQEFARDLYLLDESGLTTTKSERRMAFAASALTRGRGTLVTVTKTGQEKVYAGISFSSQA